MPDLKRRRWFVGSAVALALLGAGVALAQSVSGSYDLSFNVIPSGGGSVSGVDAGGSYSLQGTIGQPVAGAVSGTPYDVNSGFQVSGGDKYRRYLPQLANDGS